MSLPSSGLRVLCFATLVLVLSACGKDPAPDQAQADDAALQDPDRHPATLVGDSQAALHGAKAADDFRRAERAAVGLSERLISGLTRTMSERGILPALTFCKEQAPRLAQQVASEHGVRIGRISVAGRQRNSGNAPTPWQSRILSQFQQKVDQGAKPDVLVHVQTTELPDTVALRVMYGIGVQPYCLSCHGSGNEVPEEVRTALAQLYPVDAATGFKRGDLRGALWVEVPAR